MSKLIYIGVLILSIAAWVFLTVSFAAPWYKIYIDFDQGGSAWMYFTWNKIKFDGPSEDLFTMDGTEIRKVLQTCLAFAVIAWITTTITIGMIVVNLLKPSPLLKPARFLPIASFLFALFAVCVLTAWPKALKKDCENKRNFLNRFDQTCDTWECFKKLSHDNDNKEGCGPSHSWITVIIATILSFISALISAVFCKYGAAAV